MFSPDYNSTFQGGKNIYTGKQNWKLQKFADWINERLDRDGLVSFKDVKRYSCEKDISLHTIYRVKTYMHLASIRLFGERYWVRITDLGNREKLVEKVAQLYEEVKEHGVSDTPEV